MKALLSHEPGGPETLRLEEVPDPQPGRGELLVRVRAAAINYPDVLIIEDKYQLKPPRPFSPGGEIAGEIEAVGENVEGWAIGDRVIAVTGFGGLAEKILVPARAAYRLPEERSFEEGAALLLTYATSIHALLDRGKLEAGQTLLVLGAAGGVGLAAVELGKAFEARVIAAVSSEEKAQAALEQARIVAERLVRDAPDDPGRHAQLGAILAGLGKKEDAINEGKKAMELLPESQDAFDGPQATAALAEIYGWVGEHDEAFRLLDHLLTVPNGLTVPTIKIDPVWDPLRKDPRFQALIDKYAPKG